MFFCLLLLLCLSCDALHASNMTWHVVWVGGQSNSVGTNSQTSGYPTWPLTARIQMFCYAGQRGCATGSFSPASIPVYGESNVGFSLTYANLVLQTLPPDHGIVLVNTGVGGTGFHDGRWVAPTGPLAVRSVAVMQALYAAFPANLSGTYSFHSMLWHQGEEDAGDNRGLDSAEEEEYAGPVGPSAGLHAAATPFQASYCTYLVNDLSPLIDFFRASFPGASSSTVFIDGGLLPYWEDQVKGTQGVVSALYALNTSRACTATADSRIFSDFLPDGTPNGDPAYRSGASGDVIHFTATQAFFLGQQYFEALGRAAALTAPVPSAQTQGCPSAAVQPPVATCA